MNKPLRILSFGGGVQSSTIALMMAHGEIEPADHAIFADTQAEPKRVYDWIDWIEPLLPFPLHRVTGGSLRESLIKKGSSRDSEVGRFVSVPFFTANGGMGRRQCTSEFKLTPIRKKTRELLGYGPRKRIPAGAAQMVIGISWDERQRMKPARENWMTNTWPLIELRMSRGHCLEWMSRNGYPEPPKSSCLECPYHSNRQWAEIKAVPEEWNIVTMIDEISRNGGGEAIYQQYLHRDLKPLADVDLSQPDQVDAFGNECEGLCGV